MYVRACPRAGIHFTHVLVLLRNIRSMVLWFSADADLFKHLLQAELFYPVIRMRKLDATLVRIFLSLSLSIPQEATLWSRYMLRIVIHSKSLASSPAYRLTDERLPYQNALRVCDGKSMG